MNLQLLILLATLFCMNYGWWEVGHMMTAQIALLDLMSRNQTIVDQANILIKALNPVSTNKSQDFVQSASWMDDIKSTSTNFWENWHYYDRPVNSQGLYILYDYQSSVFNSVDALKRAQTIFTSYQIGTPPNMERAMFLRMIIHIIGDIHQPLHNSNYFNRTFNNSVGDMGGNLINVTRLDGIVMNLHAYWDSGALYLNKNDTFLKRPLSNDDQTYLENWAQDLMQTYDRASFQEELKQNESHEWTRESFDISNGFIYPFVEQNNAITQEFEDQARQLIQKQVVQGGYRLADFLYKALNGEYIPAPKPNPTPNATNTSSSSTSLQNQQINNGFLPIDQNSN